MRTRYWLSEFLDKYLVSINSFSFICLALLITSISVYAQTYNKGIGIYPGNPKENFSPSMKTDNKNYRNIAIA